MKIQNIDENFSKIHNALANKLLPAVKRYAVGTEPVREAAKVRDFVNSLKCCETMKICIQSFGPRFMNKQRKYEYQHSTTIRR